MCPINKKKRLARFTTFLVQFCFKCCLFENANKAEPTDFILLILKIYTFIRNV